MGLVFHLAEIAVLLAIAYAVGWGVGYGVHRIVARPRAVAVIPPERLAAATGATAPPADLAPVIAPVTADAASAPPPPADPALEIPISPEVLAALETPGAVLPLAAPAVRAPQPAAAEPPPVASGPAPVQPTSRPGLAWGGTRKGREAVQFEPPVVEPTLPEPLPVVPAEPVAAASVAEPELPPAPPEIVPPTIVLRDDAEAMRSIEAIGNPAVAAPVVEAQAAVSAAKAAVEEMLARSEINPPKPPGDVQAAQGKPVGLPRPRDGVRDDLRQIAGIGPLDVNVLNNLGIFHFDQIATLDEREVLWLENHAFARGRIGREGWQEQASTLAEGGKQRLRAPN